MQLGEENERLKDIKEKVLPLLMTGQVSVNSLNYDLLPPLKQNVYLWIASSNTHIIMAEQKTGFVYILTNPCFKSDYIKIGMTVNLKERLKQLDNTSTPLPFEIYATLETTRYKEVEKLMHHIITAISAEKRVRDTREFYELNPKTAAKMLEEIGGLIDDAHFSVCDEAEPAESGKSRRPPFRFSMVGIKEGTEITFQDSNITVKVYDDRHIEYEGETYTMSNFAAAFMPEDKKNKSMDFCGPEHFTYKGKSLSEIRNEKENEKQ